MLKTLTLMAAICLSTVQAHAQHFKISFTQGIGLDPQLHSDSLFFAKRYDVSQLRIGYHVGKLGFIANTSRIGQRNLVQQTPKDPRLPEFLVQSLSRSGDISTICATAGLELCVPLAKRKVQWNAYLTGGIATSSVSTVSFEDVTLLYSHTSRSKARPCLNSGFSFNYKINQRLAAKVQQDWLSYSIPYAAVDRRLSTPEFNGVQAKNLLTASLGFQYKF
jgi:hypothetical protein